MPALGLQPAVHPKDYCEQSHQTQLQTQRTKQGHLMEDLLFWVGLAAVAVNAITGVLEAESKDMDLLGAIMIAAAAALGGGSLRDVLLDRPVFWIANQIYLEVGILAAVATFYWGRRRKISPELFLYPDALGLALFSIVGTQIALQWEAPWLAASLLGVITGVFGGVLRDVFCNQIPLTFLPSELYATASWMGSLTLIGLQELSVDATLSAWIGMATVFLLRAAAIHFKIKLPTFQNRP